MDPLVAHKRLLAAVEAIYDAAPDPSLWPSTMQCIADCFGDVGAVLIWQRDDGGFGTIVSASLAEAQRDYEANGWNKRDLLAMRSLDRSLWLKSDAITNHDAVSDEEMATHPFFTEFSARHGLLHRLAIGVAPDPHVAVAVSIQRSNRKLPYSNDEIALASNLGRHVEKALRLSIRLFDAEIMRNGLIEAFARLKIGIFVLDRIGRLVLSNTAGDALLGDGLSLRGKQLSARFDSDQSILRSAIAATIQARPDDVGDPRPILISRTSSRRPLAVYVLPLWPNGKKEWSAFLLRGRAIVLAVDPVADEPPDASVVRDLLGITLGEARIAALIGFGLAPREAAERLGISEGNARTALKRVFSKVGISRQSELVALLTKLVLR